MAMIQEFVDRFIARKKEFKQQLKVRPPGDYKELVERVIRLVSDEEKHSWTTPQPDPARVTEVDYGDYQGTLLYVIGGLGYQPSDFWYVRVSYGSCSGCDTLQSISGYRYRAVTDDQVDQYWTLALHVVQNLRSVDGECV